MDNIEISIDEPVVEITDEYSVDYDLPIASATTLGGVKIGANISETSDGTISVPIASTDTAGVIKVGSNLSIDENGVLSGQAGGSVTVDSTLSTVSTNPVQNRVITSEINSINTTVGNIQSSVEGITSAIGGINEDIDAIELSVGTNTSDISNLQSTVETNTGNIASNTENIATNTGNITALDTRLDTDEGYITAQGNALGQLQDNVDAIAISTDTTVLYTELDTNVWTSGTLQIIRRGKIGFINIFIQGNLTLAANATNSLYQLSSVSVQETYGVLLTDDGAISVSVTSAGYVVLQNLSSQHSVTLTKVTGSVPVIFA